MAASTKEKETEDMSKKQVVNPYKRKEKKKEVTMATSKEKDKAKEKPASEKEQLTYWYRQVPEMEAPTDPSLKSSNKVHPIQSYLREFTKGLPRSDETGYLYKPDKRVMKEERVHLKTKTQLDAALPPNPHYIPEAREWALRHKPINMFWDENSMKKARDEFYVPSGARVIVLCPEAFDRPLLRNDDNFRTHKGGVMTPCPRCKTNQFVSTVRFTSGQVKCQRVLNEANKQDLVIGAVYGCKHCDQYNVESSCAKYDNNNNLNPRTFTVYTKDNWSQYPDTVKSRYLNCVNEIGDVETNLWMSPEFADKLLFHPKHFDAMEREMADALDMQGPMQSQSYNQFVLEQKSMLPIQPKTMTDSQYEIHKTIKWPAFKGTEVLLEYFKSPSADTLIKMFELLFEKVRPYLFRYQFSMHGGRFLRVDGTHNIMKKTMDMKEVEKENNCLVKMLGEYSHITQQAFCEGEDKQVVERLTHFTRKRYERIGGMPAVRKVTAGCSDTCCAGGDPQKHYLPLLFPGCKRAWLKDVWHGCDTISRATNGFGHDLHDSFMKTLWSAMLKNEHKSLMEALKHFQKHDEDGKNIKDQQAAIEEMLKKDSCRRRMCTYISPKDIKSTVETITTLKEETKAMDEERKADAASEGKPCQRCFKRTIPAQDILGAEDAIDNLIKHIEKGCFVDPPVPRAMSYPETGKEPRGGGPVFLKCRRGTNVVELDNKHSNNYVTGNAARQRSSMTDKKLLLCTVDHNLKCDKRIQHITNKKPLPRHWFIMEALQKDMEQHTRTTFNDGIQYPPELDLELHMEPFGELYQLWEEWDKHDKALRELYNQAERDLAGIASHLVPVGDGEEESMPMPAAEEEEDPMPELEANKSPVASPAASPAKAPPPASSPQPVVAQLPPMVMTQQIFSARVQAFRQEQSPARKKTKPTTNMLGANRYGIRKSSGDTRAVNHQWIHTLNHRQKELLDDFYSTVMRQHNNQMGTDALAERMAQMLIRSPQHSKRTILASQWISPLHQMTDSFAHGSKCNAGGTWHSSESSKHLTAVRLCCDTSTTLMLLTSYVILTYTALSPLLPASHLIVVSPSSLPNHLTPVGPVLRLSVSMNGCRIPCTAMKCVLMATN